MRPRTCLMIAAALAVSQAAAPGWARAFRHSLAETCRHAPPASAACGHEAYAKWPDGSPARPTSQRAADPAGDSGSDWRSDFGAYDRSYGFGR